MSAIISKLSWLQKMYNYLYSRISGSVLTVNGSPPDESGNIAIDVDSLLSHPYKGIKGNFVADDVTTVIDIVHDMDIDNGDEEDPLRYEPYTYSLTTSQPISNNHLNRTITWPDANTMRITFLLAPNEGEDARYIVNIFK